MHRYGVKTKAGKVVWIIADEVQIRRDMILFLKRTETGTEVLAGFPIAQVDHFGRPESFGTAGI